MSTEKELWDMWRNRSNYLSDNDLKFYHEIGMTWRCVLIIYLSQKMRLCKQKKTYFYESEVSIASKFGISKQKVSEIVQSLKYFKREGKQGQRRRKWTLDIETMIIPNNNEEKSNENLTKIEENESRDPMTLESRDPMTPTRSDLLYKTIL